MRNVPRILTVLLLVSCAQNNSNNETPANTGGNTPVTPQGPPGWSEVSRDQRCSPPENAPLCTQGTFTVTRAGKFRFESDVYPEKRGAISDADLNDLNSLASRISEEALKRDMTCAEIFTIPEIASTSLMLKMSDGNGAVLYEVSQRGRCYRTDPRFLAEFFDKMTELETKYLSSGEIN